MVCSQATLRARSITYPLTLKILDSVIKNAVTDPIQFSNSGRNSELSYGIRNTRIIGGDPQQGGGGISLNLQSARDSGGSTKLLVEDSDMIGTTGYGFALNNRGGGDGHAVHTFSSSGEVVNTEHAVDAGNDGLVILDDGTKYVSSVRQGTVSRISRGQPAEVIASGIPSAASMAYDSSRHRLIIPMNNWNAVTLVDLD